MASQFMHMYMHMYMHVSVGDSYLEITHSTFACTYMYLHALHEAIFCALVILNMHFWNNS